MIPPFKQSWSSVSLHALVSLIFHLLWEYGGYVIALILPMLFQVLAPRFYEAEKYQIPPHTVVAAVLVGSVVATMVMRYARDPARRVRKYFGYTRTLYEIYSQPYYRGATGTLSAYYEIAMEWEIDVGPDKRRELGFPPYLGPYFLLTSEGRHTEGTGQIQIMAPFQVEVFESGQRQPHKTFKIEPKRTRHGHYQLHIDLQGINKGERVRLTGKYLVEGRHAVSEEELTEYMGKNPEHVTVVQLLEDRNRLCEMFYHIMSYAKRYKIELSFPPNYPVTCLEPRDVSVITINSIPVGIHTRKLKPQISKYQIKLEYGFPFLATHGLVLYWQLPGRIAVTDSGVFPMLSAPATD